MDEKTKKRGWVKNAVIIFLAIMLVLTFFSNTIMNRNLPQVATQYVSSGSIAARIRGQGTLTANAPYEVTFGEARKVQSVLVKVGNSVEVGDVLIKLVEPIEDENSALQQAIQELETAQYNYRVRLLEMAAKDYTKDNREIAKLREHIKELQAELAELTVSEAEMTAVKIGLNSAETRLEKAKEAVEEAQKALDAFLAANPGAGDSGDFDELTKAYNAADTIFKAKCIQYAKEYNEFFEAACRLQQKDNYNFPLPAYLIALYEALGETTAPPVDVIVYLDTLGTPRIEAINPNTWDGVSVSHYDRNTIIEAALDLDNNGDPQNPWLEIDKNKIEKDENNRITNTPVLCNNFITAFNEIQTSGNAQAAAYEALVSAMNAAGANSAVAAQKAALEKTLKEATDLQNSVQKEYDAASKLKEEIEKRKADYDEKKKELETAQDTLEDKIFELSEQQKADNKDYQRQQLDLEKDKKAVEDAQAKVDRLSSGESVAVTEIKANAAGKISEINITAGQTIVPEAALMTIDQTDRGYTLSFSVTNEQAQKVHIGDQAEVSTDNWWFDGVIEATLTSISNNPSDPRNSRMLVFTVTGDVEPNQQLTLALGERSRTYELVVPKSAIRSDSNGKFVLMLEQRASALGNRYYATRIDVEELASDDTLVAISGAISAWDYVITSASMPVEPGQQVRLTEN